MIRSLGVAVCAYHPDRPGVGICMRCRTVICIGCCTRIDGVNHCHACLKKLARPPRRQATARVLGVMASVLLLGVAWLLLGGALWLVQGRLAP